jgi:hypothetical protein
MKLQWAGHLTRKEKQKNIDRILAGKLFQSGKQFRNRKMVLGGY